MNKFLFFILLFCITYTAEIIHGQVKPLPKNVSIDLPPDKENLDVF